MTSSAQLPHGAFLKEISAWYNHNTIPRELRAVHSLPPEKWALVVVDEGEVNLFLESAKTPTVVSSARPELIAPETPFRLESTGKPVRFCLHYYHDPVLKDAKDLAIQLGRGRAA